ncbi:hypothetical protein [Pedobacter sp. MW01-1-1]|uniref:hypothetical protein n=1 Tax=Pedobacter sp. MW01-1-1 TaxID=3383027 RepID=UPI003FEE6994
MKNVTQKIINSIIRGIVFLIPIAIIVVLLSKVFGLIKKLQVAMNLSVGENDYFHAVLNDLIVILIILIFCFIAGMLSMLKRGKGLVDKLESTVLCHIPGYNYTKATAQSVLGVEEHNFQQVVMYRDDDGKYQLSFKVEDVGDDMAMIFSPGVPKPQDGELLIVRKDLLIETDLTMLEAFSIMKNLGGGGGALLGKYFTK